MKPLFRRLAIVVFSTVVLTVACDSSDDTGGTETAYPIIDNDFDGVGVDEDCDDNDALLGAVAEDADCDGVLTADDCDDNNSASTIVAEDADCDGVLTADDCDDSDPNVKPGDVDGDGYSSCDGDCNDNDGSLNLDDVDGDGYTTCDNDCDDTDENSWPAPFVNSAGGSMAVICAGTFDMGCTAAQQATGECFSDESPVHSVTLTHDFYIGETEVTQGQYMAIMVSNPSYYVACGTDCPVEYITWHKMAEYANALSVVDGLTECFTCSEGTCSTPNNPYTCDGYRLPTEAEWEYAARAGKEYVYAGSNTVDDVAWYYENTAGLTYPVAQKEPNAWGLYDMSGNVYEWLWDWYDEDYYHSSPSSDPDGAITGSYRVARGGYFSAGPERLRVSYRYRGAPEYLYYGFVGFRLARTIQ